MKPQKKGSDQNTEAETNKVLVDQVLAFHLPIVFFRPNKTHDFLASPKTGLAKHRTKKTLVQLDLLHVMH